MVGVYDMAFLVGQDGVLSAEVTSGDNVTSPVDQSAHDGLDGAITGQIGGAIHDAAAGQQWRSVGEQCANGTDPTPAITFLQNQVDGNTQLGLTAQQKSEIKATLADTSNWDCDPVSSFARFHLRAERLVAYPDHVQLVWFDSVDTANPNYAFYAAVVPLGADSQMCNAAPTNVGAGFPSRVIDFSFVNVERGFAQ